jgi:hypothetical protein
VTDLKLDGFSLHGYLLIPGLPVVHFLNMKKDCTLDETRNVITGLGLTPVTPEQCFQIALAADLPLQANHCPHKRNVYLLISLQPEETVHKLFVVRNKVLIRENIYGLGAVSPHWNIPVLNTGFVHAA